MFYESVEPGIYQIQLLRVFMWKNSRKEELIKILGRRITIVIGIITIVLVLNTIDNRYLLFSCTQDIKECIIKSVFYPEFFLRI